MEILNWIENWYSSQCDGDWEHQYGIVINTIDKPGWQVKIDLIYTYLEDVNIEYELFEISENDWYGYSIKNKIFEGAGDPTKLTFLLNKFKEIAIKIELNS